MLQKCRRQESGSRKKKYSSKKIDYRVYRFSNKEMVLYVLEGIMLISLLGFFFYRSLKWTLFLSPLVILFIKRKQADLCKKRKQELSVQFKDALNSINNSLQAGYSMENAFIEAYKDMAYYHGTESVIAKELSFIKTGIRNSQSIEELLCDLGERSGVEDILDFTNVMMIGKQSGGNLNEIIQSSVAVIEEKIDTKQEIQTLISSKKLEAGIMSVIPFLIILYIELTSKGYFDTLYQTIGGNILMTICLGIYIAAIGICGKIMNIEV